MRRRLHFALIWALAASAGPAGAAEIFIQIDPADAKPSATSLDVSITDQTGGNFALEVPENSLLGNVEISIKDAPASLSAFSQTFELPFFFGMAEREKLAAAAVNPTFSGEHVNAFLKTARTLPSQPLPLVILNQQARALWQAALKELNEDDRVANKDDVRIAYQLLLTTRQLVDKAHMHIDDVSFTAIEFLETVSKGDDAKRLLGTSTAGPDQVQDIIKALRDRDSVIFTQIVQYVSRSIGKPEYAAAGCQKVKLLLKSLDQEHLIGSKRLDGYGANRVEATIGVALCQTKALAQLVDAGTQLTMQHVNGLDAIRSELGVAAGAMTSGERAARLRSDARRIGADLEKAASAYRSMLRRGAQPPSPPS